MKWIEIGMFIIAVISLIVTSFLTLYIFIQNNKLNKKQTELQKELHNQQSKQDKLIIKIQERPYLENSFKMIYKSYDLIEKIAFGCVFAKRDGYDFVALFLRNILEENQAFFDNFDFNFDIAVCYADNELKDDISEIKNCLIDIEKQINRLYLIHKKEIKETEDMNNEFLVHDIIELCEQISYTQKSMTASLKKYLKIEY